MVDALYYFVALNEAYHRRQAKMDLAVKFEIIKNPLNKNEYMIMNLII